MSRQRWGSLSWLILGILICIGSFRLTLGNFHNPGPGFLPFICGAILAGLSFVSFLQEGRSGEAKAEEKPFIVDRQRAWKATLTLIALLAYAIGMEYLGFLVSTTIFLVFLSWVVEPQRWYIAFFGSILASAASYTIFEILLKSPLPKGIFEF
ncbi:MAG: tripartite tricarboxylate transporter TctB family protein [Deltaproteobacteria bacterium]|nr:tripartite tricarboxylate transporter TctB family protein [Deltaproteobacteria bacterium]